MILPEVESVYMLNGSFFEGESFSSGSDEVLYLTVLPLKAAYLPYTIKLIGGKVAYPELAFAVKIGEGEYALKLGKRGYVFGEGHNVNTDDVCCKFFYFVKGEHFDFAFKLLSSELKAGLSDKALRKFFDEFTDIVKVKGRYYLVGEDGVGKKCGFDLKDGKIDNITID